MGGGGSRGGGRREFQVRKREYDLAGNHCLAPRRPHELDQPGVEERPQPAVEEKEHEKAAVDAISIGIGEHEQPAVAGSLRLAVGLQAGSDRVDERPEERMAEQLPTGCPGGIERLALHREDGLHAGISHPGHCNRRRITFDDDGLGSGAAAVRGTVFDTAPCRL